MRTLLIIIIVALVSAFLTQEKSEEEIFEESYQRFLEPQNELVQWYAKEDPKTFKNAYKSYLYNRSEEERDVKAYTYATLKISNRSRKKYLPKANEEILLNYVKSEYDLFKYFVRKKIVECDPSHESLSSALESVLENVTLEQERSQELLSIQREKSLIAAFESGKNSASEAQVLSDSEAEQILLKYNMTFPEDSAFNVCDDMLVIAEILTKASPEEAAKFFKYSYNTIATE